jgi:hypothetical protein
MASTMDRVEGLVREVIDLARTAEAQLGENTATHRDFRDLLQRLADLLEELIVEKRRENDLRAAEAKRLAEERRDRRDARKWLRELVKPAATAAIGALAMLLTAGAGWLVSQYLTVDGPAQAVQDPGGSEEDTDAP